MLSGFDLASVNFYKSANPGSLHNYLNGCKTPTLLTCINPSPPLYHVKQSYYLVFRVFRIWSR